MEHEAMHVYVKLHQAMPFHLPPQVEEAEALPAAGLQIFGQTLRRTGATAAGQRCGLAGETARVLQTPADHGSLARWSMETDIERPRRVSKRWVWMCFWTMSLNTEAFLLYSRRLLLLRRILVYMEIDEAVWQRANAFKVNAYYSTAGPASHSSAMKKTLFQAHWQRVEAPQGR